MVCNECRQAVELELKVREAQKTSKLWKKNPIMPVHPKTCGCTCQHRPLGSWKGKVEADNNNSQ